MKIMQINVINDVGSTGRTMSELSSYLIANGNTAINVYGHGKKPRINEYRVVNQFEYYIHNILSRLTGKQGHYSLLPTKRLIRYIENQQPDIIHLRNLHGNYLNLNLLFEFLSTFNKPVVWTTHDFWLITGGCPFLSCNQWKNCKCNDCVKLKNNSIFWSKKTAISNYITREKLASFKNFHIQANSIYSLEIIKQSMFSKVDVRVIYNWIDLNDFKVINIDKPKRKKPLIFVMWALLDKNSERFKRFVSFVDEYMDHYDFAMAGKIKNFSITDYPNINFLNPSDNKEILCKYYNDADLFLNTSVTDTFGKVVAESISCGTPVVAFNIGPFKEIIIDGLGCIIDKKSTNFEINNAIKKALSLNRLEFLELSSKHCKYLFSKENNCKELLHFYDEILKN